MPDSKPTRRRVVMGPPSKSGGVSAASKLRVSRRKPAKKPSIYGKVTKKPTRPKGGGSSVGVGPAGRIYEQSKE